MQYFLIFCITFVNDWQNLSVMKEFVSGICKLLALSFVITSLSSCASILSGVRSNIYIDGEVDEPVTITSSYKTYEDVQLPTIVEVNRRKLDGQHVKISSEHHSFDDIVLERTFNYWALVGGGIAIDMLTNAVSMPKYDQFHITPTEDLVAGDSIIPSGTRPIITLKKQLRQERLLQDRLLPEKYPRHEIRGSIGSGANQATRSTNRFLDEQSERYQLDRNDGYEGLRGRSYVVFTAEYHYRLNRKWDLGGLAAWGYSALYYSEKNKEIPDEAEPLCVDVNNLNTSFGYEGCRTFSFAPSMRYTWYEQRMFRLYSRVALGAMRQHLNFAATIYEKLPGDAFLYSIRKEREDRIKWRMAYQITPLGVTFGKSDHFKSFLELGYGCLGVVNFGFTVCL